MSVLSDQLINLTPPAGYGLARVYPKIFPEDFVGHLTVWEPPRRDQLYVVSVDVGDGIGQDASVIDVTRVGTILEPDEQVAQWYSPFVGPLELAPIVEAIGKLYRGNDDLDALVAIECNNHGLVTQAELQKHHGYSNFFIWQVLDPVDPDKAYTTRIGWWTTPRTRPIILARLFKKLKAVDPLTGLPDYRINSAFTIHELRTFRTLGGIREAEADPTDPDAHDDAIMAAAIGVHVASTLQYEGEEPLDQQRRRAQEAKARQDRADQLEGRDFQNTDASAEEMDQKGWSLRGGQDSDVDFAFGMGGEGWE